MNGKNWRVPHLGLLLLAAFVLLGVIFGVGASSPAHAQPVNNVAGTLAWLEAQPTLSPPARDLPALAYDSVRHEAVLFGGRQDWYVFWGDTWEWDGVNWSETTPITSPAPRLGLSMAYDSGREEVLLFGGSAPALSNDTWLYKFVPTPVVAVEIDIKPGSDDDCINSDGHGPFGISMNLYETSQKQQIEAECGAASVEARAAMLEEWVRELEAQASRSWWQRLGGR